MNKKWAFAWENVALPDWVGIKPKSKWIPPKEKKRKQWMEIKWRQKNAYRIRAIECDALRVVSTWYTQKEKCQVFPPRWKKWRRPEKESKSDESKNIRRWRHKLTDGQWGYKWHKRNKPVTTLFLIFFLHCRVDWLSCARGIRQKSLTEISVAWNAVVVSWSSPTIRTMQPADFWFIFLPVASSFGFKDSLCWLSLSYANGYSKT